MGYDLLGHKRGDFRWNISDWPYVLELASFYGWEPKGTTNEDFEDWNGTYFSNDYQKVDTEDARNLGIALDKAIYSKSTKKLPTHLKHFLNKYSNKRHLMEFIKFCKKDAFYIS